MTSGSIEPWWDRWPGLLEAELAELAAHGYEPDVDEEFQAAHGVIRVKLRVERPDTRETMDLVATYPDLYPYLRPEVQAPDLRLERHQNPFVHNLCLLPRGTRHWDPGLTLAELIRQQLPQLFQAVATAGTPEAAALEENAGEPFSDYYETWPQAGVLIDSSWRLPGDTEAGYFVLGYEPSDRVRGAVLSIEDEAGNELASAAPEIRELYVGAAGAALGRQTIRCRWVRLDAPPDAGDARAIDQQLSGDTHGVRPDPRAGRLGLGESGVTDDNVKGPWDVIGLVYPEEVRYQGVGDGWLFLARKLSRGKKSKLLDHRLVKAWRTGRDDVSARVPSTRPLRNKRVLLIGAGGSGRQSPSSSPRPASATYGSGTTT